MGERADHPRAVLITGVYGSGKSSVAAEIADIVEKKDRYYALLDLDFLGWAWSPSRESHGDDRLLLANLAAIVGNYVAAGIELFVAAGYAADPDDARRIVATLDMPTRIVRLDVPWDEIRRRLSSDITSGRQDDLRDAEQQFAAADSSGIGDLVVRNDRPLREVATEIVDRLGW